MTPLMMFLASSFNIELVYVILKGITQFSYLNCGDDGNDYLRRKANKLNLRNESDGKSKTLILTEIKIKDLDKWSGVKAKDVKESDNFTSHDVQDSCAEMDDSNVLRMKQQVEITYHRIDMFQEMYSEYFNSQLANFHDSLSPKFNRDMVFKAGEGAGRSGSFFFFSHDRKFIIKTMTSTELSLFLARLPAFKDHLRKNQNSLLAKIFGVFTINTEKFK